MKKMKGKGILTAGDVGYAPSLSPVPEDPAIRFRHRALLQDYRDLQKETDAMRRKMEILIERKLTLLAEVQYFIDNEISRPTQSRHNVKPKNSGTKSKAAKRKEPQGMPVSGSNVKKKQNTSTVKRDSLPPVNSKQGKKLGKKDNVVLHNSSKQMLYQEEETTIQQPAPALTLMRYRRRSCTPATINRELKRHTKFRAAVESRSVLHTCRGIIGPETENCKLGSLHVQPHAACRKQINDLFVGLIQIWNNRSPIIFLSPPSTPFLRLYVPSKSLFVASRGENRRCAQNAVQVRDLLRDPDRHPPPSPRRLLQARLLQRGVLDMCFADGSGLHSRDNLRLYAIVFVDRDEFFNEYRHPLYVS
ncbi:hypothetical protein MLD38_014485 [Melastoma candidum]|uniref:Uncharacterized protein n=1 Tax=Melastoma candidum TaxID=119954 RepID=A0ACB9RLD2_9MYRT|nr:hypothetical protein MLD38_014485 [Melastoma candidum]